VPRHGAIKALCAVHDKPSSDLAWGFNLRSIRILDPIHIGLISDEPIRLAGLASVFDQPSNEGQARLVPVTGTLEMLLTNTDLEYLVVDLSSSSSGLDSLNVIRRARPAIRLIVIGPQGNDELIQETIIAGARAYLNLSDGPELVRKAIEEVTRGSIWAPRRVLSRLIDRLIKTPDSGIKSSDLHLTGREQEVLDLILLARPNREIARQLGIEERTVKAHVGRLMRKTGCDNRIELSMRALNAAKGGAVAAAGRRLADRRKSERRQVSSATAPITSK
jgi:DNA-binding NarL/FixJ family response regulator